MLSQAAPRVQAMHPTWSLVHAERRALVDDLATLSPDRWDLPSWCPGWSVHDVAAHLVDNARATTLRLVIAMVRARFDFDRQNDQGVARERGADPAETLERLRAVAERTDTPPVPLASRLVEEVVHGEDVRRPLGLQHTYAEPAVAEALVYQARTSVAMGGGRQHTQGLRLVATDTDLAVGEVGEVVAGTAVDLLLAVSGRFQALVALDGPGAEVLRTRLQSR